MVLFRINKVQYALGEYLMCCALIWMVFACSRREATA